MNIDTTDANRASMGGITAVDLIRAVAAWTENKDTARIEDLHAALLGLPPPAIEKIRARRREQYADKVSRGIKRKWSAKQKARVIVMQRKRRAKAKAARAASGL